MTLKLCQAALATSGGSSTVALGLVEGLGRRGVEVRYCHLDECAPVGDRRFLLRPERGHETARALDVDPALCGTIDLCSQLLEHHDAHPFDLFHLHSLQVFGPAAAMLKKLRGVPYVVTLHGSDVLNPAFLDRNAAVVQALLDDAAAVTCVSRYLAAELRRKLPRLAEPEVIANFLRPDLDDPNRTPRPRRTVPPRAGRILHVSSLRPVKRPELALEAFARLRQRRPRARLTVISGRDGVTRARELLRGFADRDAVEVLCAGGDAAVLGRAYDAADALLLTSRFEGFGLVLLEALAHRRPVVAAAVGAVPEVLGPSWPWLVEQHDDPAAYAARLDACLGDDFDPRLASGVLERFDRERQVDRYLDLYRRLARAKDPLSPELPNPRRDVMSTKTEILTKAGKPIPDIPDRELYRPRFNPWCATDGDFGRLMRRVEPYTLVSAESCFTLYSVAQQAAQLDGEFWECGVYQGGSAILLAEVLRRQRAARGDGAQTLRLFDTFDGMPPIDPERDLPYPQRDRRDPETLASAALEAVRERLAGYRSVSFHPGMMPETFSGHEAARIALAHVDVDLYRSVRDACEFIYPRLVPGGVMVFDDYGYPSCPGARRAVDDYFRSRPEVPLVSPTAQALVFKLP